MDRQKLSKVVLEHLREREHESTGWKNAARLRWARAWGRFGALSIWEKAVLAAAAVLFVVALPAAIFAFSVGGGDEAPQVIVPASDRDDDPFVLPTATPYDRPDATPKPIGVGGSPPIPPTPTLSPQEINRQDCDAIAGTPYQSEEERLWYIANCPEDDDDDDSGNVTNPPTQPPSNPPTQPPAPPPDDPGLSASEAAAMGAQFLGVSPGACSASDAGAHWRVTCNVGGSSTTVCVFEQPTLVDFC